MNPKDELLVDFGTKDHCSNGFDTDAINEALVLNPFRCYNNCDCLRISIVSLQVERDVELNSCHIMEDLYGQFISALKEVINTCVILRNHRVLDSEVPDYLLRVAANAYFL